MTVYVRMYSVKVIIHVVYVLCIMLYMQMVSASIFTYMYDVKYVEVVLYFMIIL